MSSECDKKGSIIMFRCVCIFVLRWIVLEPIGGLPSLITNVLSTCNIIYALSSILNTTTGDGIIFPIS